MIGATFILFLFLQMPGSPPVTRSAPVDSLEECLEGVNAILEQANPEWPNGTVLQAGCVMKLPDRSSAND